MMLPIIGGLFLVALLASRKSPPQTEKFDENGGSDGGTPLPDVTDPAPGGVDAGAAAGTAAAVIGATGAANATILTSAPLAGAAVAYTVAGAVAGQMITGTTEGAVIGALNPVVGNAGNLGAQGARELHKLFGGDGQWGSLSGTTFQIAGFAAGVVTVVFGALAGIAFIPIVLVLGAVASAIEDANRLAFGQAGARKKFADDVIAHKEIAVEGFAKLFPDTPVEDLNRYGYAFAVGWVNKLNMLSWVQWSRKSPGIGMTTNNFATPSIDHMKYGLDRGYWYSPSGTTEYPLKATLPLTGDEFWALEEKTVLGKNAFANAINAGMSGANVFQYIWCMNQPRGFMVSDQQHAEYWNKLGWFEGAIGANGTLLYNGLVYDYRLKDQNFVVGTSEVATPSVDGFVTPTATVQTGTVAATIEAPVEAPIATPAPAPDPVYVKPSLFNPTGGLSLFRRY